MISVLSLYAAAKAYRHINEFRPKTSESLFDTFETAPTVLYEYALDL